MATYSHRLAEVKAYFDNGDTHLGYRRLLDAAIETRDFSVYADTLAFCDTYDAVMPVDIPHEAVASLLEKIGNGARTAPVPESKAVLEAKQVTKAYSAGSFRLSPLDLVLHPRDIIGLVGENGNGKTTVLRLLSGELKPDSGSIEYHLDHIPAKHHFYDVKTRLAFIPQRPNAWYGSLMDNLQFTATHFGFTGNQNRLWTEMICARMGLRAFRDYTWSRISSGYKMRFELARALVKRPEILLLDEPLANLDVLAQQVILEDLRFLAQSDHMPLGIILSSQQLYEVEKVSRQVLFLKQGVPRFQDTRTGNPEAAPAPLVTELETSASRETLQEALASCGLQKISYNGGVFLLYFSEEATVSGLLRTLGEAGIPVKYFRDISASSRRFFDA